MSAKPPEKSAVRYDKHGPIRMMASDGKWILARRPHCKPFAISIGDWALLDITDERVGESSAPLWQGYLLKGF